MKKKKNEKSLLGRVNRNKTNRKKHKEFPNLKQMVLLKEKSLFGRVNYREGKLYSKFPFFTKAIPPKHQNFGDSISEKS